MAPPAEPMAKPNRTLVEHTNDVVAAFDVLFGTPGRPAELTAGWLRFFRLSDQDRDEFLRTTRLACFVHDWGKANSGFAAMLFRTGQQAVRHEVISALLLNRPEVASWLRGGWASTRTSSWVRSPGTTSRPPTPGTAATTPDSGTPSVARSISVST